MSEVRRDINVDRALDNLASSTVVFMCVCMYVCVCLRMYVGKYACIYIYIYMHVRMCVRMHVCTYVRMYVCTYRFFKYKIRYVQYQQFSLNSDHQCTITLFHPLLCKIVAVLNKAAPSDDVWMAGFTASRGHNLNPKWW
jgi:hypothetical protein